MPQVTMPQLGEGVEQGTIGKWLKAVGDHVRVGDPLVEVVTDKVNAEVPSPFEGTLSRILVAEGETIANDVVIAEVETTDGAGAAAEATPGARGSRRALRGHHASPPQQRPTRPPSAADSPRPSTNGASAPTVPEAPAAATPAAPGPAPGSLGRGTRGTTSRRSTSRPASA